MIKIIKNIENQLKKDFKPSSLIVIDNTYLHKKHKNFSKDKFHIKLIIESSELKKIGSIEANRKIHGV